MDFSLNEEQQALAELAAQVFQERAAHDRLSELGRAAGEDAIQDPDLWAACAQSGLLGVGISETHGGAGMGLLELLPVLEATGRFVAPIPVVETLVLGAGAVAQFGTSQQQAAILPAVVAGELILSAAFDEGLGGEPMAPVTGLHATRDGASLSLRGTLPFVGWGAEAGLVLVPVAEADGVTVVLLPTGAAGVTVEALRATNHLPMAHLHLDDVVLSERDVLGGPDAAGEDILGWLAQRGAAAWSAVQAGVCEGAVSMLAAYTSTRRQFDKPIAEFQAVAQRAADAFIDAEMVRLTARHAVYRLAKGLEAGQEVHVAKFWAGDGAMRVVHAAQHLHGGIGVDLDYPLHRYFLWAKRIEHTLGTPTRELIRLGALLADEPV